MAVSTQTYGLAAPLSEPSIALTIPNRRRRILFVDHTATMGGGEIALLHLVTHLDHTRFIPVVLLCADGPLASRLIEAGIETHILPLAVSVAAARKDSLGGSTMLRGKDIARTLHYVEKVRRLIRALKIDLVHTNSLKADLIGGIAGRFALKPVIWHVRDRIEDDYLPHRVVRLFRLLCRFVPNFVVANSHATLSTLALPGTKQSAAIYSGVEFDGRMRVVHDGINHIDHSNAAEAAQKSLGRARIGLVGRISPWKGQHIFLHAAALVLQQYPETKFQIIGAALFNENGYEEEIRALASSLDLNASVEFTGFRSDVPELIAGLDILVHASTTGEPFGQVVVEGMAAGKPVVATNGGGIPEIVQDGVTGLLVPMGDAERMAAAICSLLADPARAEEMGRCGQIRAKDHFAIELTARRVESVYDKVLKPQRFSHRRKKLGLRPSEVPV